MARGRRGSRSRRGDEQDEVVDTVHEETSRSRRERAPRVPGGPAFAVTAGLAAGIGAGLLALLATMAMAKFTTVDPFVAFDAGGVQAARMLAAVDVDRWSADFGTHKGLHRELNAKIEDKLAQLEKDEQSYVEGKYDEHVELFRKGTSTTPVGDLDPWPEWLGFDVMFPRNDPTDELIERARTKTLEMAQGGNPGAFVGASINTGGGAVAAVGQALKGGEAAKTIGDTKVYVLAQDGKRYRAYEHPLRNRIGNRVPGATALVTLDASGIQPPDATSTAAAAGGAAFLGAFLLGFLATLGPVRSLRKLAQQAATAAGGDLSVRITAAGPALVESTAKSLQRLTAMAQEGAGPTEVVTEQVVVQPSKEIVHALAPTSAPPTGREFEVEATHKVCDAVGNDYHDMIEVDDEHVGFIVADIPLRGVEGAMLMAQIKALFRAAAPGRTSPAAVLKEINRTFARDLPRGIYATAVYAVCSRTTGVCKVANAQHLPLVFWKLSRKSSARVPSEGIALGLDPGPVFDKTIEEKAIQLERGDRIVLFTDGAIAARNAEGAQYGEQRFYYVVNREAPKNSAAFVNFVANDVDLFHDGAPQMDDFTILTVRKIS